MRERRIPRDETLAREYLANEWGLLAWLRTAIGAIGLGILLGSAMDVLIALPGGQELEPRREGFAVFGMALVVLGAVINVVAAVRFLRYRALIGRGAFTSSAPVYLSSWPSASSS